MSNSVILIIAGLDPTGGAGISADIRAVSAMGAVVAPVISAIANQGHREGVAVHPVDEADFAEALDSALTADPQAVKIGMAGNARTIEVIADRLAPLSERIPIVLDPVLRSSSGMELADLDATEALIERLFPIAALVTPNLDEAGRFASMRIASLEDILSAGARIAGATAAVLIKGGHSAGIPIDYLFQREEVREFQSERVPGEFRGTGCALASLIACGLARGEALPRAVSSAKARLTAALGQSIPPYIRY